MKKNSYLWIGFFVILMVVVIMVGIAMAVHSGDSSIERAGMFLFGGGFIGLGLLAMRESD